MHKKVGGGVTAPGEGNQTEPPLRQNPAQDEGWAPSCSHSQKVPGQGRFSPCAEEPCVEGLCAERKADLGESLGCLREAAGPRRWVRKAAGPRGREDQEWGRVVQGAVAPKAAHSAAYAL